MGRSFLDFFNMSFYFPLSYLFLNLPVVDIKNNLLIFDYISHTEKGEENTYILRVYLFKQIVIIISWTTEFIVFYLWSLGYDREGGRNVERCHPRSSFQGTIPALAWCVLKYIWRNTKRSNAKLTQLPNLGRSIIADSSFLFQKCD